MDDWETGVWMAPSAPSHASALRVPDPFGTAGDSTFGGNESFVSESDAPLPSLSHAAMSPAAFGVTSDDDESFQWDEASLRIESPELRVSACLPSKLQKVPPEAIPVDPYASLDGQEDDGLFSFDDEIQSEQRHETSSTAPVVQTEPPVKQLAAPSVVYLPSLDVSAASAEEESLNWSSNVGDHGRESPPPFVL